MVIITIAALWLLVGAVLGIYEARRGHWHWLWLLGAIAGPFSIPLFRQIEQNEALAQPQELSTSTRPKRAGVHVLVGVDGSDDSIRAVKYAADLFGSRLGDLTLATVTDFEMNEVVPGPLTPEEPWDSAEKAMLTETARSMGQWLGFEPATVLLNGRPATALQDYAQEKGCGVVVVGARGRGLSKRVLGSCAAQLMQTSSVPIVVVPRSEAGAASEKATSSGRP